MTGEDTLLTILHESAFEIENYVDYIKAIPKEYQIDGFDDGKIVGLIWALERLHFHLNEYYDRFPPKTVPEC